MTTIENIEITTFVNPHLFWIIEHQDEHRLETLKSLQRELKSLIEDASNDLDHAFKVGQLVAVEFNKQIYRAVIEVIYFNGFSEENEKEYNSPCQCWLIDYGTMVEVKKMYKLPITLIKAPPLALQICLNNIGYIQQHVTYDNKGQPLLEKACSTVPNPRCRQESNNIFSNFQTLDLVYDYKDDGVYFGDIICKDGKTVKSLRTELIKAEVLVENIEVFKTIKAGINTYREQHLRIINSICKKNTKCLEKNTTHDRIERALEKIKHNFNKFIEHDDYFEEEEQDIIYKRRDHRLKRNTSDSSDGLNSSDDLYTSTKSDTSNMMETPKLSSREKLIKLIQQKKSSPKEIKPEESPNGTEVTDVNDSTSNISGLETNSENTSCNSFDSKKPNKHNLPKNIMFVPAGACYTIKASKKKRKLPVENEAVAKDAAESVKNDELAESIPKQLPDTIPKQSTSKQQNSMTSSDETVTKSSHSSTQPKIDFVNNQPRQLTIKPHCRCSQCEHWTDSKNWIHTPEYSDKPEKRLTEDYKHAFFKKGQDNEAITIQSIDYNEESKLRKKSNLLVLVHSEVVPTRVKSIYDVSFHKDVLRNLKQLNYNESKKIQMYTWPSLLRNHNIFMVHGSQTGKTLAYLPIMCTFLMEKDDRYQHILKTGGPIIIILCANTKKCEDIHCLTKKLLGINRSKVSLVTYPNSTTPLHNIDMLITTPTILVDLLKCRKINFKRLCHFILEDGSKIMNNNPELLSKIFNLIDNMLENRKFSKTVQLVICAEHWNAHLKNLLKTLKMLPLVCIGNFLEAALYGGMNFSMKFLDSSSKAQEMISLVKEIYTKHKTVIFCDNTDIEDVKVLLLLKGINAVVMTEDLSQEALSHFEETWIQTREGQHIVLVCTDFLFTMMSITCASILIHYSLPQSWTEFVKRFRSLLENCRSPVYPNEGTCRSIVFCDENSEQQMHKFFSYINRTDLKYQLPDELRNFSETLKIMEEEEKIKKSIDLCSTLKLFGKCTEVTCHKRHILSKGRDVCESIPNSGRIRFKILDIVDLTCFSVQIIQHIDQKHTVNFYDDLKDVTEDLTNTLKINKTAAMHPTPGCNYAFYNFDEDELFYRCRLLENEHDFVKIILIDQGNVVNTMKSRIFKLPKEFNIEHYPQKTLEVYLSNYIPPYQDECFSSKAFSMFKNQLEKIDYKNKLFHGVITLQLGHTLWINDVYEEKLLSDKSIIRGLQLGRQALTLELVQFSQSQFKRLQRLCETVGIAVPEQITQPKTPSKKTANVIPQWAYLDVDKPNEVIFSSAISPEEFYVRLYKFDHLIYMLQKDIQIAINRPNYPKIQSTESGDFCLARLPNENDYHRGIILKIDDGKALCFFADFGDEAVVPISELKYLEDALIKKLPFQSIQCSLQGIKSVLKEWQDDATNILYDYAVEPQSDIFRSLYVKVGAKDTSSIKGQKKYSVLLKDGFGERNILINQLLIDCGLACPNSEIIADFELSVIEYENDDDAAMKDDTDVARDILKTTDEFAENFQPLSNSTMAEDFDVDFVVDDPLLFFQEILDLSRPKEPTSTNRELPPIKAAESVDYCTPQVVWYQTETAIRISVKIENAQDCYINLNKNRILSFSAKNNDQLYKFKLMLYEPVESLQQILSETDVRLTLIKSKSIEWPRLILSNQRSRNIRYDLTKLKVEEKRRKFLEIPKEIDDGLESDDNDMMYNFCSDLDSDYDQDLPHDSD